MKGTMLWFNPAKRHGFIRTEDGERLLVEETGFAPGQLVSDRCRGTEVSFVRVATETGDAHATDVSVLPLFAARRARSRRR